MDICNKVENCWFWNTNEWSKYLKVSCFKKTTINYTKKDYKKLSKYSMISWNQNEVYIYYLMTQNKNHNKEIINESIELAILNNYKKIISIGNYEYLHNEFLPLISYTNEIDLKNYKYRKNVKYEIKKARENKISIDFEDDFKKFRNDYFKIAGKQTRPIETFQILKDWKDKGYGKLFVAKKENCNIAYVYILIYKNKAYYFMSGIFEEYKKTSVGYLIQHEIINYLKSIKINIYETGEQEYLNLHNCPTEKQINISSFKRAFGGNQKAIITGEKYLDEKYFDNQYKERLKKYKENYFI